MISNMDCGVDLTSNGCSSFPRYASSYQVVLWNKRVFSYRISFLEPYYSGGSAKDCSYQLSGRDSLPGEPRLRRPVKLKPDHVR